MIKVRVPKVRHYDPKTKEVTVQKNVLTELESTSVCCLADIPVLHLSYQSTRYGKFALGFHREAAIKHGFNPVFYTLHDTEVIQSIYEGFAELEYVTADEVRSAADDIESEIDQEEIDLPTALSDLGMAADDIESEIGDAKDKIEKFLAFVKTFDGDEFGSIYCEREWRATTAFSFGYSDLAMLVIPKKVSTEDYFDSFILKEVKRLDLPRSIPIVPWEDLVES